MQTTKEKSLLPSLKEKKRYLAYEVISEKKLNNPEAHITDACKSFLGELEMAKAGINIVDKKIIRVNNNYVDKVKSALMLIQKNQKVIFRVTKVSGALNKARR